MIRIVALIIGATIISTLLVSADVKSAPKTQDRYCGTTDEQEHIRDLLLRSMDDALKQHIAHLYSVRMRDTKAPLSNIAHGINNGIKAHIEGTRYFAQWKLQEC